jgi:hypothetical protein
LSKRNLFQILLENIKLSKQKLLFTVKIKKLFENKLDSFSSKQQRFIKQRKFTWQSPYMVSHSNTPAKLNLNYQNKKNSISDFTFAQSNQNQIFGLNKKIL